MRGKKGQAHTDPADRPRRRANKARGHGTYATDRPPIFSLVARDSGTLRYFVREHADKATCQEVIASTVVPGAAILYTDEWQSYREVGATLCRKHATVCHGKDADGKREWARDDDGDGIREVHCNSCEGAGTGLRTFLRMFRGVHKYYLAEYVAVYETMFNAKRITAQVIRSMCFRQHATQSGYT